MLSQAEIFADLKRRRYEAVEEGWTVADYAKQLGISVATALRQIKKGVEAGQIKPVGNKMAVNDNGRVVWASAYLFNAEKAENHRTKTRQAPVARAVPHRRDH